MYTITTAAEIYENLFSNIVFLNPCLIYSRVPTLFGKFKIRPFWELKIRPFKHLASSKLRLQYLFEWIHIRY